MFYFEHKLDYELTGMVKYSQTYHKAQSLALLYDPAKISVETVPLLLQENVWSAKTSEVQNPVEITPLTLGPFHSI